MCERRSTEIYLRVFKLYGTSACHLCELAYNMLKVQQSRMGGFDIEELDISYCNGLFDRYGVRIPVLQHPDQRELDWPFSQLELQEFLES
ncbi:MAG: glutaredoxin family protein [Halioglobus sp.]|nr:glutaredoxin family protein [Halioglobus sp.]